MTRPHIDVGWGKQPLNEQDNEDLILDNETGAWSSVLFRKFKQSLEQLKQLTRERTTAIFVVGGRGSGKSQILRDLTKNALSTGQKDFEYLPAIVRAPTNVALTWDSIELEIFNAICDTMKVIASNQNSNNKFPKLRELLLKSANGETGLERFAAIPPSPERTQNICKTLKNNEIRLIIALDDLDKRPNADIANFLSAAQTPISEILEHARLLISIRPGQWNNILEMGTQGTNYLVDQRAATSVAMPGIGTSHRKRFRNSSTNECVSCIKNQTPGFGNSRLREIQILKPLMRL